VCNGALVKREHEVPWNEARINAENKEQYKQLCVCVCVGISGLATSGVVMSREDGSVA
jgi:hypothetical protein